MKTIKYFLLITTVSLLLFNCKKKDKDKPEDPVVTPSPPPSPLASVVTAAVINITDSTAVCGGTVTSEGTSVITAVGVCWDTLPSPTTLKSKTNNGAGTGNYISNITGLKINKTYYVRSYATNGNGTVYGNEISFNTPSYQYWTKSVSASSYNSFYAMLSDGPNIFAGTSSGVIFSSDTGNTWSPKGLSGVSVSKIYKKDNFLFVVSAWNKLYRSPDNGNTWNEITNNFPFPVKVADVVQHGNKLVAGTDSSVFYSNDNGDNWVRIRNGLPKPFQNWGGGWAINLCSNGSDLFTIATQFVGPDSDKKFYRYDETNNIWVNLWNFGTGYTYDLLLSSGGMFLSQGNYIRKSTNNGNFWSIQFNLQNPKIHSEGTKIFVTNPPSDFKYSSDGGTNWSSIKNLGLPAGSYYSGFISNHYAWVNTSGGIYKYKLN